MDFNANHFALFGLPVAFQLDQTALEEAYRKLQNEVHPDRFAAAGEAEKRLSMQWATKANEAYQTLKKPILRGAYMLQMQGIDVFSAQHTSFPPAFLMQQMMWREAIGDARASRNMAALDDLTRELRKESNAMEQQLATALDTNRDDQMAGEILRKLKFMHKLIEEVGDAQEELDAA